MNDSSDQPSQPVPLLDVVGGNQPLREQILEAITAVVDSGRFLHGPDCQSLEQEMSRRCGTEYAIGCASGSDALLLAMMALEIGPGDEVILPSFTFFATASCVWRVGARPVFADIDPVSFNLDPDSVAAAISPATRAIIPVHLFGQCADMDSLMQLADQHGLAVVEDAAQAIDAQLKGRTAGGMGDVGCFSFYPTKNLGGMGDGGMLTTNDARLAEQLRLYAAHGMAPRYYHQVVGVNSRLDSIQAAALCVKMTHLDRWTQQRQRNATRYAHLFEQAGLDQTLGLPATGADRFHVWNQFTLRVPDGHRDPLRQFLSDANVGAEIYYPVPLHRQACFESLEMGPGSLPVTEQAVDEVLSLPIFPELTESQQQSVVDRIAAYYAAEARHAA